MIDHLVFAVPDVAATCDELERDWGVRPRRAADTPDAARTTRCFDLGDARYLEVIGPDADQPAPAGPRPFWIDGLARPRLVTWAAKAPGIDGRAERARAAGYDPGPVRAMWRVRPDGARLEWRLTRAETPGGEGVVPFPIDWGASPHPAASAPPACRLLALHGEHPRPGAVRPLLAALDVTLEVRRGKRGRGLDEEGRRARGLGEGGGRAGRLLEAVDEVLAPMPIMAIVIWKG